MFSFGSKLMIFILLVGFGALVNAVGYRIWRSAGEEAATTDKGSTAKESPVCKAA